LASVLQMNRKARSDGKERQIYQWRREYARLRTPVVQ
jgi:hypothetical protein